MCKQGQAYEAARRDFNEHEVKTIAFAASYEIIICIGTEAFLHL
jgi:hypothetical protein